VKPSSRTGCSPGMTPASSTGAPSRRDHAGAAAGKASKRRKGGRQVSRFGAAVESQSAQLAGRRRSPPRFNGYFAALIPGASAELKLRRNPVACARARPGSVTSDQHTLGLFRQTVRAATSGFTTTTFQNLSQRGTASVSTGIDITTGPTSGPPARRSAPTPLTKIGGNTQGRPGTCRGSSPTTPTSVGPGHRQRPRDRQHRQRAARVAPVRRLA